MSLAPSSAGLRAPRKPPTLSLLGCGCAGLVLAALLGVVGFTVHSYRQVEGFKAGYGGDAERAAERVRNVLPYRELPPGYFPLGGLSLPLLLEVAILTDLPPGERAPEEGAPRFRESGFLYVSSLSSARRGREMRARFEGEPGDEEMELAIPADEIGSDLAVAFSPSERIGKGALTFTGGEALYVARRGELTVSERSFPGLATTVYLECPSGRRTRLALWFGREPAGEERDLRGTAADPEALAALLAHFEICG